MRLLNCKTTFQLCGSESFSGKVKVIEEFRLSLSLLYDVDLSPELSKNSRNSTGVGCFSPTTTIPISISFKVHPLQRLGYRGRASLEGIDRGSAGLLLSSSPRKFRAITRGFSKRATSSA